MFQEFVWCVATARLAETKGYDEERDADEDAGMEPEDEEAEAAEPQVETQASDSDWVCN